MQFSYKLQNRVSVRLLFTVACFLSTHSVSSHLETDVALERTDPRVVGMLYDLMKVTDEIFQSHGVKYWIHGGTLLGAERHNGVIPWDENISLQIFPKEEFKLRDSSLRYKFKHHGYRIYEDWHGFKVVPRVLPSYGKVIKSKYSKKYNYWPRIIIWSSEYDSLNKNQIKLSKKAHRIWTRHFFYLEEVLPLQRIPFGPITVMSVNFPDLYLERSYGKDWGRFAVKSWNYTKNCPLEKTKYKLVTFEPARYEFSELPR